VHGDWRIRPNLRAREFHIGSLASILIALALASCSTMATKSGEAEPTGSPPYELSVGGAVKPPVAIHRVEPEKPAGVAETGRVPVQSVVGLDGIPRNLVVLEAPHPKLAEVSVNAVKGWRFRPGTLHGKPVETLFIVRIAFH
jgi:hypothetical protein